VIVARHVTFDEFWLIVLLPAGLEKPEATAMRRVINGRSFRTELRRAINALVRRYPSLARARIRLRH
jgi:hypothetical protein